MTLVPVAWRMPVWWLALLALAACSSGPLTMGSAPGGSAPGPSAVGPSGTASDSRSARETRDACRARVNEMYERRDRGDIYAANSGVNSPNSGEYLGGVPGRGLSAQYAYERTIDDCVRNGTGALATEPPSPASTPPGARGP